MFMTRVQLKRLPTPDVIHSVLSAAFPGKRSENANENLWRVDNLGDTKVLIIVSTDVPDLKQLVISVGKSKVGEFSVNEPNKLDKTVDYEPFLKSIANNQKWNFRLCANPVEHKRQTPTDKRGKVFALRSISEQLHWVRSQGDKNGFSIIGCSVTGDSWIAFDRIRIRSITFDGLLTVKDPDAFRRALTQGIGRGKAYGCGLLTIAKTE